MAPRYSDVVSNSRTRAYGFLQSPLMTEQVTFLCSPPPYSGSRGTAASGKTSGWSSPPARVPRAPMPRNVQPKSDLPGATGGRANAAGALRRNRRPATALMTMFFSSVPVQRS